MTRTREKLILVTLWVVMFTTASQFLLVAPILPRMTEALGFDERLGGSLVSVYAAMVSGCALLAGPISDRVGRVAILRVGSLAMALSLLVHGLAWDYASLLFARGLAGFSSGVMAGAAAAYVGDVFPYARRGAAMGWVMSAMAFGQILGIPLGTVLADAASWSTPFVALGVLMLAAWTLTISALQRPEREQLDPFRLGSAARGYLDLLLRPEVRSVNIASMAMMFSVGSFIIYLPSWMEQALGASPRGVALMFLLGGLAQAAASPTAGALSDRVGRKALIVVGSLGTAVFFAATPLVTRLELLYGMFPAVMILVALRITPLQALTTALTGPAQRGSLMSLNMCFSQAGFAVGAGVAGWAWTQGFAMNGMLAGAAAVVAAGIVALWVPEPEADAPTAAPARTPSAR